MTGLVVLAAMALLWFCYVTFGIFLVLGGAERAPQLLVRIFDHFPRAHSNGRRRWLVMSGAVLSLAIGLLPQLLLVREVLSERTNAAEDTAIILSVIGSGAWLAFMRRRYRPDSKRVGS